MGFELGTLGSHSDTLAPSSFTASVYTSPVTRRMEDCHDRFDIGGYGSSLLKNID